jgi:hypothetical protein
MDLTGGLVVGPIEPLNAGNLIRHP